MGRPADSSTVRSWLTCTVAVLTSPSIRCTTTGALNGARLLICRRCWLSVRTCSGLA